MQASTHPLATQWMPGILGTLRHHVAAALALGLACGVPLAAAQSSRPLDIGPVSITGLANFEATRGNGFCVGKRCGFDPSSGASPVEGDGQRDAWSFDQPRGLVGFLQPTIDAKFDLPNGAKITSVLTYRWRNGNDGLWLERGIRLEHEDWGNLTAGSMTTQAWHMANYPFGGDIGITGAWSSSGAVQGLQSRALRVTSRLLDALDGDIALQATWNHSEAGRQRGAPNLAEIWLGYSSRDLNVDLVVQQIGSRSEFPSIDTASNSPVSENSNLYWSGRVSQGLAMAQLRWRYTTRTELLGAWRLNRWDTYNAQAWLSPTRNSDGLVDLRAAPNKNSPGYLGFEPGSGGPSANSMDVLVAVRHKWRRWTLDLVGLHLGRASEPQCSALSASRPAHIGTIQLTQMLREGLYAYGLAGAVRFIRDSASSPGPSAPATTSTGAAQMSPEGRWLGIGMTYRF